MRIEKAKLAAVAAKKTQFPDDGRAEIALVGRSNVGKSTLLNALCAQKGLARTSSSPGKTRLVFFFEYGQGMYLVDLPGYGYAKASHAVKHSLSSISTSYFTDKRPHVLVLILLDIRRGLGEMDKKMMAYLDHHNIPWLYVLTKADKLTRNQRNQSLFKLEKDWAAYYETDPVTMRARGVEFKCFTVSADKGAHDPSVTDLREFLVQVARDPRLVVGCKGGIIVQS